MIHPGPWQNYRNRPDNRNLTTEELTYKYKQELLVHENFSYQQIQIQHQDYQGKRAPVTSTPLEYPEFDGGPFSVVYYALGYNNGVSNLNWPTGLLNQTSINNITTITATATPKVGYLNIPSPIVSWVDLSIGDTFPDLIGGITQYRSFVTHRGIPQPGVVQPIGGSGPQWTSGDLEYIFTYDSTNGEIVDINTFIVP